MRSSSCKSLHSVLTHLVTANNYEDVGDCIENADRRCDTLVNISILTDRMCYGYTKHLIYVWVQNWCAMLSR